MLGRILIGAFRVVPYIPGPVVRATVSCAAAVLSGIRPRPRAVRQLRLNLDRVEAAGYPHVRTYDAVRNYLRYFADVFVLSSLTAEQRNARVTIELPDEARTDMANGSIIIALGHQGDWDLAGAWFSSHFQQILSVAEKLEPPELVDKYVELREEIGMRIITVGEGEHVFDTLVESVREHSCAVALLADRDISGRGVEVSLAGKRALAAAGPAALAQRLDLPIYVGDIRSVRLSSQQARQAGSRWGIHLRLDGPHRIDCEAESPVQELTRRWFAVWQDMMMAHAQDWHMMQPIFVEDLDPRRLARARARAHADGRNQKGDTCGSESSAPTP